MRVRFGWATDTGLVGEVEVDGGNTPPTLAALAAALAKETKIGSAAEIEVLLSGAPLTQEDVPKLSTSDLVLVRRKAVAAAGTSAPSGTSAGAAVAGAAAGGQMRQREPTALEIREHVRNSPNLLTQLLHQNPVMAEAVLSDDISVLESLLAQQAMERRRKEQEQERQIAALNADPFDLDAQRKIEEVIREENVRENYESALEVNPESFGRVVMLYISCAVNGRPLSAFVDSGAQSTIMSAACAERCGLMRLVDRRFAGIAKGVGTAKIIGRVHVAPLMIGSEVFTSSFTILQGTDMDFLLGLDMLRKHQACINLRDGVLEIGSQKAPFLAEKDIPLHLRSEGSEPASDNPTHVSPPAAGAAPAPATGGAARGAAAGAPPPAAAVPKQAKAAAGQYAEEVVKRLMDLGATREQVISALNRCGGNPELAASLIFSAGMDF